MLPFLAALGAMMIRLGYVIHASGMARSKNSAGAILRQLCDLCIAFLAFWAVGGAILDSGTRVMGIRWSSLCSEETGPFAFAVLIATGIVPAALAERARFWPSLASSVLLAALVIPVAALWAAAPTGWLVHFGLHDSAGASWLHLPGAVCAAVGAICVGPRAGKFNRDGSSTAIPGHSVPLAGIGVFVLLVGLFAFISVRSGAGAINTLLAASAAGLASVLLGQLRYYKPDIHLAFAGVLGGVVAISAGADVVPGIGAVLIGAVAGVLVPMAILWLDVLARIDDPSGNIAVHGVGAIWGLIATPLLMRGLSIGERFQHLGTHLLAILAIAALTAALSAGLWALLQRCTRIRASEADEFDGLDLAQHDIGAYPDFQQNTIKSYHLREV